MALLVNCNKCGKQYVQADIYTDWPEDCPKCPYCLKRLREKESLKENKHIAGLYIDAQLIQEFLKHPRCKGYNLLEGVPEGAILQEIIWEPDGRIGIVFSHESFEEEVDGRTIQEIYLIPAEKDSWPLDKKNNCEENSAELRKTIIDIIIQDIKSKGLIFHALKQG